jgi:hypothetical protein
MGGSSAVRNGPGHRAYRRAVARLRRRVELEGLACDWCGQPFDLTLEPNDRRAFTADHPDALANGGALVGQQLHPLHRVCNAEKGAGGGAVEVWSAS